MQTRLDELILYDKNRGELAAACKTAKKEAEAAAAVLSEKRRATAKEFAEKVKVPFESLECSIPAKWDEVLTILFGPDYMTPPPEAERVAKHLDI